MLILRFLALVVVLNAIRYVVGGLIEGPFANGLLYPLLMPGGGQAARHGESG
ncbi:MAG TPA: hypothetical protein VMO47_08645 [Rhodothermales bacterium]|nr:hypothetical protein [Rhodothermales bacterium]